MGVSRTRGHPPSYTPWLLAGAEEAPAFEPRVLTAFDNRPVRKGRTLPVNPGGLAAADEALEMWDVNSMELHTDAAGVEGGATGAGLGTGATLAESYGVTGFTPLPPASLLVLKDMVVRTDAWRDCPSSLLARCTDCRAASAVSRTACMSDSVGRVTWDADVACKRRSATANNSATCSCKARKLTTIFSVSSSLLVMILFFLRVVWSLKLYC